MCILQCYKRDNKSSVQSFYDGRNRISEVKILGSRGDKGTDTMKRYPCFRVRTLTLPTFLKALWELCLRTFS